jgi:hypothetical protein
MHHKRVRTKRGNTGEVGLEGPRATRHVHLAMHGGVSACSPLAYVPFPLLLRSASKQENHHGNEHSADGNKHHNRRVRPFRRGQRTHLDRSTNHSRTALGYRWDRPDVLGLEPCQGTPPCAPLHVAPPPFTLAPLLPLSGSAVGQDDDSMCRRGERTHPPGRGGVGLRIATQSLASPLVSPHVLTLSIFCRVNIFLPPETALRPGAGLLA